MVMNKAKHINFDILLLVSIYYLLTLESDTIMNSIMNNLSISH